MTTRSRTALAAVLAATVSAAVVAAGTPAGAAPPGRAGAAGLTLRSPELSETSRLADRRALVVGDRLYAMGAADGSWPATGFHTRGEMGGVWSPPIKLLDGVWFGVDGQWVGPATRFTSGWGYTRRELPSAGGLRLSRTDVVPDGIRAGLIGLHVRGAAGRQVTLTVDAHSELMDSYPWGETKPANQLAYNLPDRGSFDGRNLVFRETGTPPVPNASRHDWTALVGSALTPTSHGLGTGFRGPQEPPVICPASGPDAPPQPPRCDDTAYGKGTGGRLTYRVRIPGNGSTTVWLATAGSDRNPAEARAQLARALVNPDGLLAQKVAQRYAVAARTVVDLPGDRLLQRSVEWSKQNLADSVQESRDLELREVNAGQNYPPPVGTLDKARWLGAGWPDYPWLFGTDGEYTAFASVAAGQFDPIKAHLRALRDVSEIVNERSGKVVHEVTPEGSVFFGANADAGNTDETAKFPSAVALIWRWTGDDAFRDDLYGFTVRNMRYVVGTLDADGDGWPEGLGNVEREGMGEEKLDNTVYTIRGLYDLADLARSRGDTATAAWAASRGAALRQRFEAAWWYGGDARQYADSLRDPGNVKVFQRHWIGLTPTDAQLVGPAGAAPGPGQAPVVGLARRDRGQVLLAQRERPCYSNALGLFHTGTGPTSAEAGNAGPSCDSVVSTVGSERNSFSLNTAIMAVSEGAYGRLGPSQQRRFTTANARIQLDPTIWEMPGASPEIGPSPDFGQNIDKLFTERSSVLQAWGSYGILWPVVHQQLGVSPDIGRDRLSVVPQVPGGQSRIAGSNIRVGGGAVDVAATRSARSLETTVVRRVGARLTIGAVLPSGAAVSSVTLNGERVGWSVRLTSRGSEVVVDAGPGRGVDQLAVRLR